MKVIKITSSVKANTTNIYVASGNVIQVTKSVTDGSTPEAIVAMFESEHAETMSRVIGFPDNNMVQEFSKGFDDWQVVFELPKGNVVNLFGSK